jgi:hypothetical protein
MLKFRQFLPVSRLLGWVISFNEFLQAALFVSAPVDIETGRFFFIIMHSIWIAIEVS